LVSEEEYLSTAYEPDCEYEDGVLIERNVGDQDHSWLQAALGAYFFNPGRLLSRFDTMPSRILILFERIQLISRDVLQVDQGSLNPAPHRLDRKPRPGRASRMRSVGSSGWLDMKWSTAVGTVAGR
jgi:hypothetical protein